MINYSNFIGYFELSTKHKILFENDSKINDLSVKRLSNRIIKIGNIISKSEIDFLIEEINQNKSIPVGIDGIASNYIKGDFVHSYRSTIYNEHIANIIYSRISHFLESTISPYHQDNNLFIPIGINPAFRFIRYTENGFLVPHYDFPYKKDEDILSLMSLVIYLSKSGSGGNTQFIKEYRENDYSDWNRIANESEIFLDLALNEGDCLLFPHNLLHQSSINRGDKIILRTDIMFKRKI